MKSVLSFTIISFCLIIFILSQNVFSDGLYSDYEFYGRSQFAGTSQLSYNFKLIQQVQKILMVPDN